jgi:hypothetical protein
MASPSDTKPQPPTHRAATHDSDAPPKPRYDEKIDGDSFDVLRRYQEVTLPPNARLKLLSAPVPVVPPEELQDTLPPNANIASPAPSAAGAPRPSPGSNKTPSVDVSRSRDTLFLPRVRRQQRLRAFVIGAVVVAVLLAVVGFLVQQPSPHDTTETKSAEAAPNGAGAPPPVAPLTPTQSAPASPAISPVPTPPADPDAQPWSRSASSASPASPAPTDPKPPGKGPGEKLTPPSSANTPKPVPTPGTTTDRGSAFDGLMRPPSD